MVLLWRSCSKATWKAWSNALANITWFISFKRTLQLPVFHSFHFNLSDLPFSFFKQSVTLVTHSALQQVPVGQEFLCSEKREKKNLKLATSQTTYSLFIFIYFKHLAVLNSHKTGKMRSVALCFFSWACSIIVCQVYRRFAVLTEAVMLFHHMERKRGRERFILEPKGRTINQNHQTHS